MGWMTEIGRRADLETIEVNMPEGYIGAMIFPPFVTAEKSGDFTVQDVVADLTCTEGRDETSTALSRTSLVMTAIDYTCVKQEAGTYIAKSEVPQYGDIARADAAGGRRAKNAIYRKYEQDAADLVFSTTNYNNRLIAATGEVIARIQDAAEAVKNVKGVLALVISRSLYMRMIKLTEVKNCLDTGAYVQIASMAAQSQLSKQTEFIRMLMQTVYPFEAILIGDDDFWRPAGKTTCCAVVKLPPANDMFAGKEMPILGQSRVYWPDDVTAGTIPCEIEASVDMDYKRNNFDAEAYYVMKVFNAEGIQLVDLAADIPATTTTTTTT